MTGRDPRSLIPASLGELRAVVPLTAGLSGAAVHAVTTSGGEYVLRVHEGDQATWEHLLAMQRLASEHGLAPRLVHVDEAARAMVTEKIAGMSFGQAAAQPALRPAAFMGLIARLAELRAIPIDGLAAPDLDGLSRTFWTAQAGRPGFPAWALPLGELRAAAARVVAADPRRVFGHNDLNPANMMWDGQRVWLLDWGGAGPTHPYLDLATVAVFLNLPDEVAHGFLAAVTRAPVAAAEARLFAVVRQFVRLTYGAVFLSLVPDLGAVAFASREETPTLAQCYALMAAGELSLSDARGQARVGAALLRGP